jgi:hypothetical protein
MVRYAIAVRWKINNHTGIENIGSGREMGRAEQLRGMSPHLIADVTLYPTEMGGRESSALPGWGCPCCVSRQEPVSGYDGWPLLDDLPMEPGEQRRVGFFFLSGEEAAVIMREAGTFYLWEGRFVGEAKVVGADRRRDKM